MSTPDSPTFNGARLAQMRQAAGLADDRALAELLDVRTLPRFDERTGPLLRRLLARALGCDVRDVWLDEGRA